MLQLLRKEWLVTRRIHLIAMLVCLALGVVAVIEPDSALFMALFTNLMYTHLVFNMARSSANSRPDNMLLNSLPLTRGNIVAAKYAYVMLCAVLFALFESLILYLASLFGAPLGIPVWTLWLILAVSGIVYHALLMPLSYLDAKYGQWASMLIYVAILFLPSRLGKGKAGEFFAAFFSRMAGVMTGWAGVPLMFLGLALLVAISRSVSLAIYRRAEF